ncbi:MAG: 2-oxo acid dehydrogenase subunit E2 [Acidimicrobiia bacterium]|nr:2-oxo acid dehydrogenase subunit E2 [Acidimicrobiia bacterium]
MAHEFHLPDIGEGLVEATILSWHIAIGERVEQDAPLVEVETDKAIVDLPSPYAGVLLFQGAPAGTVLPVEALLAVIGDEGEQWAPDPEVDSAEAAPIVGTLGTEVEHVTHGAGVRALPAVRKLATDLGVDIETVMGSGPGGRVTADDVRAVSEPEEGERRPLSPTRRAIAENLSRSWREIPHVTTYDEADATALLARRAEVGKPPLEALLIEIIVPLLHQFPEFNATLSGSDLVVHERIDVGIAVDTPEGLMVGVVRDAPNRDVAGLGDEILRLAKAARTRTATADDLRGQTFTLSNIGAVGGRFGTPIVPYGTTAILSVGRADPRPVVRDDQIVVGREFPLSLSYDHRVIDGATGRAFVAALKLAIESA